MPLWGAVVCSAAGGVALWLSFQPVAWWPFAFVSVTAALAALAGRSVVAALLVGGVFGAVFYTTHLVWVGEFLGPLPLMALALLQTLLYATGGVFITLAYRWTARSSNHHRAARVGVPLVVGGVWAAREIVMASWPYSGFPWARLGISQVNGPLADLASWTGVTGLSFLIVVGCAGVLQWAGAGSVQNPFGLTPLVITALILVALPQFPTTANGVLQVGWVQGNGPAGFFDEKQPDEIMSAQLAATTPLLGRRMDLLVWPEGSVDSDPLADARTAAALDTLVQQAAAPLLMNAATQRGSSVFNTSLLWTGTSQDLQLHDKANPVPFGEYVPDRWLYELVAPDLVGLITREYTPGSNPPVIKLPQATLGLAICFDVIYDAVIWEGTRSGAELFVFQTNNADFRGTDENLQQLAIARMRAIETGRTVVNVSTVGTSQVIAADGSTIDAIGTDIAGATITAVPLRTGLTPASVIGPWLTALIPVGAGISLIVLGLTHRRHRQTRNTVTSHPTGGPDDL